MRFAVILAGGGGTRLWPASRRAKPKQFLSLDSSGQSLIAATFARLESVVERERILVVTAESQAADVASALPTLPSENILSEPASRNTAPAIGLALVEILSRDPDAVVGVLPSDHHIGDPHGFAHVLKQAFTYAESHQAITTVGIVPHRPDTGYGYMEVDRDSDPYRVKRFVEKPDYFKAREYLESGRFLWNAGIFFSSAKHFYGEIKTHLPELADALDQNKHLGTPLHQLYGPLRPISIDFGVMEKTQTLLTIPADVGWSDVGTWAALGDINEAQEGGNVALGSLTAVDSSNNIVVSDDKTMIALLGVDDLIVVQSGNGILIAPRGRAQDVRDIVSELKAQHDDDFY